MGARKVDPAPVPAPRKRGEKKREREQDALLPARFARGGGQNHCFWIEDGSWKLTDPPASGGAYNIPVIGPDGVQRIGRKGRPVRKYCGRGALAFAWLQRQKQLVIEGAEQAETLTNIIRERQILEAQLKVLQEDLQLASQDEQDARKQLEAFMTKLQTVEIDRDTARTELKQQLETYERAVQSAKQTAAEAQRDATASQQRIQELIALTTALEEIPDLNVANQNLADNARQSTQQLAATAAVAQEVANEAGIFSDAFDALAL